MGSNVIFLLPSNRNALEFDILTNDFMIHGNTIKKCLDIHIVDHFEIKA